MTSRDRQREDVRKGTMSPMTFRILRRVLYGLCKVLFRLDVQGAGNIPKTEGCIIVSNHLHNLDPVLICIACPRPLHYMAKVEVMRVSVLGRFLTWVGAFPINRGKIDRMAIKRAHATLEQNVVLGMFPEGTRSTSMKIEHVLPGAGLLALRDGVQIIPTAITGTERLPFNGIKQHRDRTSMPDPGHKGVRIVFGDPFLIPSEIDGKRTSAAAATDYMMQRVAALLPNEYRGIYSAMHSGIIEVEDEIA